MPRIIENAAAMLIEEARRQVDENGYDSFNIRTVARNCGIAIGTVYNYFPSKDALIAAFLAGDWNERMQRIGEADFSGSCEAAARAIYAELTGFLQQHRELFRAASATIPAVPKQYHVLLRSQIAQVLLPAAGSDFRAAFLAEALLTWTVEGVPFDELWALLKKTL